MAIFYRSLDQLINQSNNAQKRTYKTTNYS